MSLFFGLLFGAVGGVYLAYARRLHDPLYLLCGVVLIVYPYFFDSALAIVAMGVVIALFPVGRTRGWF